MTRNLIYLLWYVREGPGKDEELLIGAYSSEQEAKAAIERLKAKRGFVDDPKGFHSHAYELNRDEWTDGFVVTKD